MTDLIMQIATLMLRDFPAGCRAFYQTVWGSLEKYMFENMQEWMGLFYALTKLIHVNPLPQVRFHIFDPKYRFIFSSVLIFILLVGSSQRIGGPRAARFVQPRHVCAAPQKAAHGTVLPDAITTPSHVQSDGPYCSGQGEGPALEIRPWYVN